MSYVDPAAAGTPSAGNPIKSAWGRDVQQDVELFESELTAGPITITTATDFATPILDLRTSGGDRFNFSRSSGVSTALNITGDASQPPIVGLLVGVNYADFTFSGTDADIDVVGGGNLNLRPQGASSSVNIWAPSQNIKLRVGSSGFGQAVDLSHDGTNAHINPTTGYVGFQSDKFQILSTGAVNYTGPTAASASAGSNGAPPAQVGGYLTWQVGGATVHVPYYL